MVKLTPSCIILLIAGCIFSLILISRATITAQPQPLKVGGPLDILLLNNNKISNACSYTVIIKTSCSSTSFTRDKISLAFGDAHKNEVYAPKLNDPSSKTFEKCSKDTFQISGPCMRARICYLYLKWVGSDGWKPESVTISAPNYKPVNFDYDSVPPSGVWFGFNICKK